MPKRSSSFHSQKVSLVKPTQAVITLVSQAVVVPVIAKTHNIKKNCLPLTFHFCCSRLSMMGANCRKTIKILHIKNGVCEG